MNGKKINFVSVAFKNLGRHKFKTIFTVLAIAIGVLLYGWMDAWLLGMNLESRRNLVNYETGSAKIYSKAYFEKKDELPSYEKFGDYEKIIARLNKEGYNAAPHAVFVGSLMSVDQELPFMFLGIDPELERKVFSYDEYLEGEDSQFVKNGEFAAVLGVKGAVDLNVGVGDKVRLSVTIDIKDEKGKVRHVHQLIDLRVGGIVNSPNPKTNGNICYLPLDILQDEMGIMLEGQVNEICIRKTNAAFHELPGQDEDPAFIKAKIGNVLPEDLVLVGWQEDAKDYLAMAAGDTIGNYVMIGILFILALMGVVNTMLMAVLERTKEIGMMKALGVKNGEIIRLIVIESGMIGLIGSIVGILGALPIIHLTVKYGIDYTSILEEGNMTDFGYRIIGIFRGAWNYHTLIAMPFVATFVTTLVALFPAKKAIDMNIVESLRFE